MQAPFVPPVPVAIMWTLTHACPLECLHCHADVSKPGTVSGELSTAEAMELVDRFAAWGVRCLVYTGGEPLVRRDLLEIAQRGARHHLDQWLITSGWTVGPAKARQIAELGFSRVLVSLDSADPVRHDTFRQKPGSFDRAIGTMSQLSDLGVRVQIITTINRMNAGEIEEMVALARRVGVGHISFQTFKPTRSSHRQVWQGAPMNLTPEEWRQTFGELLRVRAANPDMSFDLGSGGREPMLALLPESGRHDVACECGNTLGSVDADGNLNFCIYAPELVVGNLLREELPTLWRDAAFLRSMRTRELAGKCGRCPHRESCRGGCPAVTWNLLGHMQAPDPNCWWQPGETAGGAP